MPIISTMDIARPPEQVFAYVTDPTRFGEWQQDVISGSWQGDEPIGIGSRYTTNRRVGSKERTTTQEITEFSAPHRWAVRGIDGPVRVLARVTVEPIDDNKSSRLTLELDFEGHGIGKLLVPFVVRPQTRKISPYSYQNLKQRLESE